MWAESTARIFYTTKCLQKYKKYVMLAAIIPVVFADFAGSLYSKPMLHHTRVWTKSIAGNSTRPVFTELKSMLYPKAVDAFVNTDFNFPFSILNFKGRSIIVNLGKKSMLYPKAIIVVVNTHFNFAFSVLSIKGQKT